MNKFQIVRKSSEMFNMIRRSKDGVLTPKNEEYERQIDTLSKISGMQVDEIKHCIKLLKNR